VLAISHFAISLVAIAALFDGMKQRDEAIRAMERSQQQIEKSLGKFRE
jgi:hypothetical protein